MHLRAIHSIVHQHQEWLRWYEISAELYRALRGEEHIFILYNLWGGVNKRELGNLDLSTCPEETASNHGLNGMADRQAFKQLALG